MKTARLWPDTRNRDVFNEEKDISFYSIGNGKPRKVMANDEHHDEVGTDLPIRRQRGDGRRPLV